MFALSKKRTATSPALELVAILSRKPEVVNRGTGVVSDAHLPSLCKNLRPVSWKISRAVSSCIRVLDNGSCAV